MNGRDVIEMPSGTARKGRRFILYLNGRAVGVTYSRAAADKWRRGDAA